MKQILTFLSLAIALCTFAQPAQINYQAVVRDASGAPVSQNTAVQFQFKILTGSATGVSVYTETGSILLTGAGGLCNTAIGINSNLSAVDWSSGSKFLDVSVKVGSGSFVDMGTTQLLSVPYAMFAGKAASATIADSAKHAGGSGGTSTPTPSVNVTYNGQALTTPSIDHVLITTGPSYVSALTNTNYWYGLYRGTNTVASFDGSAMATDSSSANPTFYIAQPPVNCSSLLYPYQGEIFGINTNHTSGVYYVPLSATGSTPATLYQYSCQTGHWTSVSTQYLPGYQFLQALPNNNSVTGFNLTFPVNVSITR
jgi:hypothetical protein